ncbi:unnamed protein product [Acanthoscelides obtectus]|uniref:Uncharacterized protein n=1 Tax=Acanthoscelides obtectus TaxID=200917 RepID=A0A9P0LQ92_ACAOB|nr:unnamed protein product [Acanthoscelides obtectus]CAK1687549.1 hypothetical protein AOBTE_LOCUS36283 [Acanthoscelides obtectus]
MIGDLSIHKNSINLSVTTADLGTLTQKEH